MSTTIYSACAVVTTICLFVNAKLAIVTVHPEIEALATVGASICLLATILSMALAWWPQR